MKNRIDTSRRKTPWDNVKDLSNTQKFISDKYYDNYNIKHPKLVETNEAKIINSILISNCRNCNSNNIIKKGKTNNGIQMYYCKSCKKRFTPTLNTLFENHKISITEWIEFSLDIFNYGSITLTSKFRRTYNHE